MIMDGSASQRLVRLVAGAVEAVDHSARRRDELAAPAVLLEIHPEVAEALALVQRLRVRRRAEALQRLTPRAGHVLGDAAGRVRCTARVQCAKSQVVVPVTVEDDVSTSGVEAVPPRLVGRRLAGAAPGEEGLVPEGEGAGLRRRGKVGFESLRLRRGR